MDGQPPPDASRQADGVYAKPFVADEEAKRMLADPDLTDDQRAEALTTLGRGAYYDNRINDAIELLEHAMSLTTSAASRADIVLTLAPALSKVGRTTAALDLLDLDRRTLSVEQRGKLENQTGIILVETGQLPDALAAFSRARDIHHEAGDAASEGRVLVNMAAAASEIGDFARAESWYAEAWTISKETNQEFASAIIEGNLGYVASRRGDFSAALSWYQRGRESFAELGDVDLLLAVLETDHATTLLDLGLNDQAYEAAEFARGSSSSGSNRMLEAQALLLRGQAQLRLGHVDAALATLDTVSDLAIELDVEPLLLRSRYLRYGIKPLGTSAEDVLELVDGLRAAAWNREALRTLIMGVRRALDTGDLAAAEQLLGVVDVIDVGGVDLVDRAQADAFAALLADDDVAFAEAIAAGELEIDRQRKLLTSAELQTRIGHRANSLRELALRGPVESGDPIAVLEALDRRSHGRQRDRSRGIAELRSQLRDVRVGLQEAQLNARPSSDLLRRSRELETEILEATIDHTPAPAPLRVLLGGPDVPHFVHYFAHRGRIRAVQHTEEVELRDLCSVEDAHRAIRAQRAGIRRMAGGDDRAISRTEAASVRLQELLVDPLELVGEDAIGIVSDPGLLGISWPGLPTLADRPVVLSPSVRMLIATTAPLTIETVALVEAGDLVAATSELEALASIWHQLQTVTHADATVDRAKSGLASSDLTHLAVHGTFRADNPFFTALEFADGKLTLVDLDDVPELPSVVSLASCDSGASAVVGFELIGTTDVLLTLGVRTIVAASLVVDDAATSRFVIDVHRNLAQGVAPIDSVRVARRAAYARRTSEDIAVAMAFSLHGDAAVFAPLQISRL